MDTVAVFRQMLGTHERAMANCVCHARQAGLSPTDHVILCVKMGTIWDTIAERLGPYVEPELRTTEVAFKVVKWIDLFPYLQAIPDLQETMSEGRREFLESASVKRVYPGVALGDGCAFQFHIRA